MMGAPIPLTAHDRLAVKRYRAWYLADRRKHHGTPETTPDGMTERLDRVERDGVFQSELARFIMTKDWAARAS